MNTENIVNIITAIITSVGTIISGIIASVALYQTKKQVELSNKQNLFNERVRIYLIINGLLELYVENRDTIIEEKEDRFYVEADWVFCQMINNSYLENIYAAIYNTLQHPEQKELLKKIEEIKNEAIKAQFVFDGDIAKLLHQFITNYANVLMELYQYQVLLDDMKKIIDKNSGKDITEVAKEVEEKLDREELFKTFRELEESYKMLDKYNIKEILENQIKLAK